MAISKTILICDDDQGMRDTIGAILKRDYRVLTVSELGTAMGEDPEIKNLTNACSVQAGIAAPQ
jgi:hypothetical protein